MKEQLSEEHRRDAERLHQIRKYEERAEPKYQQGSKAGAVLSFLVIAAIVGVAVFYMVTHWSTFAPKPSRPPAADTTNTNDNGS